MKKQREKTGDSIDEKPPKLNKKTRRKMIVYLYALKLFTKGEKPLKSSKENEEENRVLILGWGFSEVIDQKLEHDIQI